MASSIVSAFTTHTNTHTHPDRQTDRQRERQTDTETDRQTDRRTDLGQSEDDHGIANRVHLYHLLAVISVTHRNGIQVRRDQGKAMP